MVHSHQLFSQPKAILIANRGRNHGKMGTQPIVEPNRYRKRLV